MTAQIPDVLDYEGRLASLQTYPLDWLLRILLPLYVTKGIRLPLCQPDTEPEERSTACWRGYIAEWKIENDALFLEEIRDSWGGKTEAMAKLFRDHSGAVKATWFSGTLEISGEPQLQRSGDGDGALYEARILLHVRQGNVVAKEVHTNRQNRGEPANNRVANAAAQIACTTCHCQNRAGSKFCENCGHRFFE